MAVSICVHLLEKGELLGDVLRAVLIFAEGDPLFTLQAGVREVVARHRQHRSNGEGLLFWNGGRRLHCFWESPLKPPECEDDHDDDGAMRNTGHMSKLVSHLDMSLKRYFKNVSVPGCCCCPTMSYITSESTSGDTVVQRLTLPPHSSEDLRLLCVVFSCTPCVCVASFCVLHLPNSPKTCM